MHNIDNTIFTIQISNILSSIVKEQITYQNHSNILDIYDSIFHNNCFIITIQNRIILKGKLNYDNSSFIIQHCPNKSILSGHQLKSIKLNRLKGLIQNNLDDIYSFDISNTTGKLLFDQIAFNSNTITKINGIIEKKKIKKIELGLNHALFLSYGGMIYVQGDNSRNQLGIENIDQSNDQLLLTSLLNYFIIDIASGGNHSFAYGKKRFTNNNNTILSNIDTQGKGNTDNSNVDNNEINTSINLIDDSVLFSWGDNTYGQCGFESSQAKSIKIPAIILYSCKIDQIALGLNHSLILMTNNDVISCGNNEYSMCAAVQYDYLDSFIQSTYPFLQVNKETILSIKTAANSSLLITNKGTLIIKGKIAKGNQMGFRLKEGIAMSSIKINFCDEHCLLIHSNSDHDNIITKLSDIKIEEKISDYNNLIQSHQLIPIKNKALNYPYEEMFHDLFNEDSDALKYSNCDSTDNSLYELRSYINLLGISFSSNYSSEMSFRPQNLPPKTKEEENLHKKLVEANRKLSISVSKHKQKLEKEQQKMVYARIESNEKRTQYWLKEIIPHWTLMKSNKNFSHYFYEGIPSSIRGQVWLLSVGNKFSITRDFYNIEVKKSIQLLLKEKTKKEKENDKDREKDSELDKEREKDKYKLIGLSDSDIYNRYIIKTTNKEKTISLIDLDVDRTFAYLGVFKPPSPLCDALREILRAFVVSRPDIGYVSNIIIINLT